MLEAMASGLPVVASDVEGVRELLGPEAAGQTVRHGDTRAIVDAIAGFLLDPTLARATGMANRRRAEETFDIARMIKAYQDLWESLAQG